MHTTQHTVVVANQANGLPTQDVDREELESPVFAQVVVRFGIVQPEGKINDLPIHHALKVEVAPDDATDQTNAVYLPEQRVLVAPLRHLLWVVLWYERREPIGKARSGPVQ